MITDDPAFILDDFDPTIGVLVPAPPPPWQPGASTAVDPSEEMERAEAERFAARMRGLRERWLRKQGRVRLAAK
jgi:hypothetical protein